MRTSSLNSKYTRQRKTKRDCILKCFPPPKVRQHQICRRLSCKITAADEKCVIGVASGFCSAQLSISMKSNRQRHLSTQSQQQQLV